MCVKPQDSGWRGTGPVSALRAGTWEARDVTLFGTEGPGCTQAWGSPAFLGDVGQGASSDGPATPADWVSTRRVHSVGWAGSLRLQSEQVQADPATLGSSPGLSSFVPKSGSKPAPANNSGRDAVGKARLQGVPEMPRAWAPLSPPTEHGARWDLTGRPQKAAQTQHTPDPGATVNADEHEPHHARPRKAHPGAMADRTRPPQTGGHGSEWKAVIALIQVGIHTGALPAPPVVGSLPVPRT